MTGGRCNGECEVYQNESGTEYVDADPGCPEHGEARPSPGCIEWTKTRDKRGYGQTGAGKRAHRQAWEDHNGPIPDGLFVLHKCDNPPCVNIDHLYVGSHQDNMDDMKARGRSMRGEKQNTAKLTEESVRAMRRLYELGVSCRILSRGFGVSKSQAHRIVTREEWRHVG